MTCIAASVAFANNPVPTVVGPVVPQAVAPGKGQFTLKIYGANFVSGSVVNWNRSPRVTTFVSGRELHATILASDVAKPTAGYITVTNPPPGGGVSSASYAIVEVHKPTKTIVAKQPHVYFRGSGAFVLALADFNNDGVLDFAAEQGLQIVALLGNGDGSFRFGSVVTNDDCCAIGSSAFGVGDFNNDGNQDLVFGANRNGPPTQLQVNFGKGNGKFRFGARSSFQFDNYQLSMAVGDFNRDGNLDVAVTEFGRYPLSVLLGRGDGSLKHLATYPDDGGVGNVAPADFNGDGILDLAVLYGTGDGGLFIQFGNGDGRFQKPQLVDSNPHLGCSIGPNVWVSDFNGDGNADLAYCERDPNSGKIWVALGNGDGTFKKPISLTVPAWQGAFSFAVGDFNSDGKTDLVASYLTSGTQSEFDLFLGNGDGTFQRRKPVKLGFYNAEEGIVPGDYNSDGLLDFIFQQPGNVAVFVQE